jgi:hypothetical protein
MRVNACMKLGVLIKDLNKARVAALPSSIGARLTVSRQVSYSNIVLAPPNSKKLARQARKMEEDALSAPLAAMAVDMAEEATARRSPAKEREAGQKKQKNKGGKPVKAAPVAKAKSGSLTKSVSELITLGDAQFQVEAFSMAVRFDDPIYESHRDVWETLTRGKCTVYDAKAGADKADAPATAVEPSGSTTTSDTVAGAGADAAGEATATAAPRSSKKVVHRMCGMRKFGYWESTCYGYREAAKYAIAMEKENGENAQISAFTYAGVRYWVVGSKNVPMILRHDAFESDLSNDIYTSKERYGFARRIAQVLYDTYLKPGATVIHPADVLAKDSAQVRSILSNLAISDVAPVPASQDGGAALHELLSRTGYSMICEAIFLDSQHLVDYSASGDDLRAFALAHPDQPSSEGLTALMPSEAHTLLRSFGVRHALVLGEAAYGTPEHEALCRKIESLPNSEGCVMYAVGAPESAEAETSSLASPRVVFMYKWKSHDYVIGRRARQLILGGLPTAAIISRIRELKDLGVQPALIEERLKYFLKFASWLRTQEEYTSAAVNGKKERQTVQAQWVTLNKRFATIADTYHPTDLESSGTSKNNGKVVIMFQGLPLTGKSTLSRQLFVLLRRAGHRPRWANQDEMATAPKGGKRVGYMKALEEALKDRSVTHILLDKSNINDDNVQDYYTLGIVPSVTVRMRHPEDTRGSMAKLLEVCKERFEARGTKHRTLRTDAAEEGIDKVLASFAGIDGALKICGGSGDGSATNADVGGGDDDESALGLVVTQSIMLPPKEAIAHLWGVLASNGLVSESLTPLSAHSTEVEEAYVIAAKFEDLLTSKPARTRYWGLALDEAVRSELINLIPIGTPDAPNIDWMEEDDRKLKRSARKLAKETGSHATPTKGTNAGAGSPVTPVRAVKDTATGASATPESPESPDTSVNERNITLLPHVHHTLLYCGLCCDPEAEVRFTPRVNEIMPLHVRAIIWDRNAVAALLDKTESSNKYPHITLGVRKGVPALYSNAMMAAWQEIQSGERCIGPEGERELVNVEAMELPELKEYARGFKQHMKEVTLDVTGKLVRNPL